MVFASFPEPFISLIASRSQLARRPWSATFLRVVDRNGFVLQTPSPETSPQVSYGRSKPASFGSNSVHCLHMHPRAARTGRYRLAAPPSTNPWWHRTLLGAASITVTCIGAEGHERKRKRKRENMREEKKYMST